MRGEARRREQVLKLILAAIALTALYAPAELTRLILIHPEFPSFWPYYLELGAIWAPWGLGTSILFSEFLGGKVKERR